MRTFLIPGVLLLAVVFGCSQKPSDDGGAKNAKAPAPTPGDPAKLDSAVMPEKPAKAISVRDAMTRPEGETVVVTGRVPGGNLKPFNTAVAAVVLMAPEDLDTEAIKEEFDCPDAATCPSCKKVLDAHAVYVEVVDASGSPLAATLEGFRGLQKGSTVTVEGKLEKFGKDKKLVRVVATKFYPG